MASTHLFPRTTVPGGSQAFPGHSPPPIPWNKAATTISRRWKENLVGGGGEELRPASTGVLRFGAALSRDRERQTALQVTATKAAGQRSCPNLHAYLPECGRILSSWHSHLARLFEKEVWVRLDQRPGTLDLPSLN